MSGTWYPRSGYEVAYIDPEYLVLVYGGTHHTGEPSWRPVATCSDRDEAYRVRDALRLTLPADVRGGRPRRPRR